MKPSRQELMRFVIFVSIVWLVGCGIGFLILQKTFEKEIKRAAQAAYTKGFDAALDAGAPSDRLEYVCAALWFKGKRHDNND